MENVFSIAKPKETALPVIFDSPHSGRTYPDDFRTVCDFADLQTAEDNHVDELFSFAPDAGIIFLHALFPRTYIDLNRAEHDLDPALFNAPDEWPEHMSPGSRAYAGIGLVRRLLKPGMPLYDGPLGVDEIKHRLVRYYRPYHAALTELLDQAHYDFGQVYHVNCHSMPAISALHLPPGYAGEPDFVVGDRDGTTSSPAFVRLIRDTLRGMGYRVAINNPYKGVEIVRRYGRPTEGRHSIQLEVSKALYWDEERGQPARDFARTQDDLRHLAQVITAYVREQLDMPMAAD